MFVKNKWNNLTYEVLQMTEKEVTLKRIDGSIFTIAKNLYMSTYVDILTKNKGKNNGKNKGENNGKNNGK